MLQKRKPEETLFWEQCQKWALVGDSALAARSLAAACGHMSARKMSMKEKKKSLLFALNIHILRLLLLLLERMRQK